MTDTGTSADGRPEYGERATPEEVAAARGMTLAEHTADIAGAPKAAPGNPEADAAAAPSEPAAASAPAADAASPGSARSAGARPAVPRWDLALTIGFLVLAVFNLANAIPGYLQMDRTLASVLATIGYDDVAPGPAAASAGIALIVIETLLVVATIILALARIRAGRRAFWVPLAGFGVYFAIASVVLAVSIGPMLVTLGQNPS